MGFTSLNRIASESVNIQIITALSTAFSWRVAYRTLGLAAIPLSLPIFLMVRHKPEDVGQLPDGDSSQESEKLSSSNGEKSSKERKWSIREIISLPSFWFILTAEFVAVAATSMVVFQLVALQSLIHI